MKIFACSILFALIGINLVAQTAQTNAPASAKLSSIVFNWDQMPVQTLTNGVRRNVFDAPSAMLERVNCHITTLNPGASSSAPRLHLQEEIVIVKEGRVEATFDGHKQIADPGSVIFLAANATTCLRNAGDVPATYTVINYYPPGWSPKK